MGTNVIGECLACNCPPAGGYECEHTCLGCDFHIRFPTDMTLGIAFIDDRSGAAGDECEECPDLNGDYLVTDDDGGECSGHLYTCGGSTVATCATVECTTGISKLIRIRLYSTVTQLVDVPNSRCYIDLTIDYTMAYSTNSGSTWTTLYSASDTRNNEADIPVGSYACDGSDTFDAVAAINAMSPQIFIGNPVGQSFCQNVGGVDSNPGGAWYDVSVSAS